MRLILVVLSLVFSVSLFASVESEIDASRFEHRNGTLIDNFSSMQWQDNKDAKTIKKNWQGAKNYCANLTLDNKSDWRLPNELELKYAYEIRSYFEFLLPRYYWSSTLGSSLTKSAWSIYFKDGSKGFFTKYNNLYVRCIRGKQLNVLQLIKKLEQLKSLTKSI